MSPRNSYPIVIKDENAVIGAVRAGIAWTMKNGEMGAVCPAFDDQYNAQVFLPLNKGVDVGGGIITLECVMLYGSYIYVLLMSRVEFDPDTTEAYDAYGVDEPLYVFTLRMLSAETDEDQAVQVVSREARETEYCLADFTRLEVR